MRDWLAGLVVGVAGGFLFFVFPALAVVVIVAFVVPAAVRRRLQTAVSGAVVGIGSVWLVVLTRAVVACRQFDAGPEQECGQPDMSVWFAAAAAMLVIGAGLALVGLHRSRCRGVG